MTIGTVRHLAAIDWIEFQIQTKDRYKFRTLQKSISALLGLPDGKKQFVLPCDDGGVKVESENGASNIFRFKIQDPKSYATIKMFFDRLNSEFEIIGQVKVIGIEVAFDTYATGATKKELAQLVFNRYRFSTIEPPGQWRLYKTARPTMLNSLDRPSEAIKLLANGFNLSDNDNAESRFAHGYVKTTNNSGNDKLKNEQWCARFERTFQGQNLPVHTLAELENFDFGSLAPHFQFRRLDDDLHPAARYALDKSSLDQLGCKGEYKRKHATKIGQFDSAKTATHRLSTVSDTELNKAVRDQLRDLSAKWAK